MRKTAAAIPCLLVLSIVMSASPVFATTTISIYPQGFMLTSPATFTVNITNSQVYGNPTLDPHILLVMTETCYKGLTGNVVVNWTEDGTPNSTKITTWNVDSFPSTHVPPISSGEFYTVYDLQKQLLTEGPIYWTFEDFLGNMNITGTMIPFTVTLPSTSPRMMVYVMGKTVCSSTFDNKSPLNQPGIVVPEIAIAMALGISLIASIGHTAMKRKAFRKPQV
jgi:hypothetical protein